MIDSVYLLAMKCCPCRTIDTRLLAFTYSRFQRNCKITNDITKPTPIIMHETGSIAEEIRE